MKKIILKDGTKCFFGDRKATETAQRFDYMMLSRLIDDCKYFLGNGGRCDKHLWAGNVKDQLNKMFYLFNEIIIKPEWITIKDLNNIKKEMEK